MPLLLVMRRITRLHKDVNSHTRRAIPTQGELDTQDLPPDMEPLGWITRMKIATGAARGLEYLHDKANPPVIYRDFKSSNILLDKGFHPKLSDFGLAKLGPVCDKSHVSTRVMGSYGYCAPEYAMTGQLTVKSDVYSFGVVFLELITGRKPIDSSRVKGQQNLIHWARSVSTDRRKMLKLADPRLEGRYPTHGLYQALAVASMCTQEEADARPPIADVVTALSYRESLTYNCKAAPAAGHGSEELWISGLRDEKLGQENKGSEWVACGRPRDDPPRDVPSIMNKDSNRERAVAEAMMWGANWRDKQHTTMQ